MKIKFLFLMLLFLPGFAALAQEEPLDLEQLDTYIEDARNKWDIPGMAVAIVHKGEIIFEKGYGVRELGQRAQVGPHTLFAVASNTKSFTAAALAQQVDRGKLSWDDRVVDYLPYFELYDPYVTRHTLVRDLLCHRVGLKTFSGDLLWYRTDYPVEEVIRRARHLEPVYPFRGHFGYSNIMYAAAGEVLKAVTDTTWDEYVKAHFLGPLRMERTTTTVSVLDDMENVASPHDFIDGQMQPIPYMAWDNMAPAAAVNSSVHEMSQWLLMQLNGGKLHGKRFLSDEQHWELQAPQTLQHVGRSEAQIWPGRHFRAYALGWSVEAYRGKKLVGHGGGADGMISKTGFIPGEDFGFVILSNSINYLPSALMYKIVDMYLQAQGRDWSSFYYNYYARRKAQEKERVEELIATRDTEGQPAFALKDYTGKYGGELYGDAQVRLEDGKLLVDFLPAPKLMGDLTFHHHNVFEIRLRNSPLPVGRVQFIPDMDGDIQEMKINIPNPDFFFEELTFIRKE